jgi:hypothetical protein
MLIDPPRAPYPVHFGLVPIVKTEEGVKMAKVFYYMVQNYGCQKSMRFFDSIRGTCFGHFPRSYVTLDP